MSAADQTQTDALLALLARVAGAVERSEAVNVAMLAELRRLRSKGSAVDLDALLPAVWVYFAGRLWATQELVGPELIAKADAHSVGMALGRLYRDGGRCGDLVLNKVEKRTDEKADRRGHVWHLTRL